MKIKKRVLAVLAFGMVVFLGVSFNFLSAFNIPAEEKPESPEESVNESNESLFGVALGSYTVEQQTVNKNDFLSTILQRYHIDLPTIGVISEKSKSVFDVRKICAGNPYTVFKDDEGKAAYFIYQPNFVDYIVYDLRDSVAVYPGKKDQERRVETVAGVINSSLYETLQSQDANPELAVQLAEIYGWAVNFYRINKGDWFKIRYERTYVEGDPVGMGRILSAVFSQNGKEYQAYYFKGDDQEKGGYFDENGKSLRRSFLKAPLKYSRISSRYSMRRLHPVQRVWKAHLGTDFAAPHGTPIIATGDGVVTEAAFNRGNGNYVKIKHDNVYSTQYLHMSKMAVKRGQRVSQGQVIGYVGSTGLATGPHVCYRFWKNGQQVDALKQQFPPSVPIEEKYQAAFNKLLNVQQELLAQLSTDPSADELDFYNSRVFDIGTLFSQSPMDTQVSDPTERSL